MAGPNTDEGDAIFSTHLHRFQSRGVELPARIVLRSSPEDDMEAKIADLQAKYPAECKAIDAPITNLYKYFDAYDQQLHGERFLHTVLTQIFERNVIRGHAIQEYARVWHDLNPTAFPWITDNGFNAFTDDDVEEYGKDFLEEVLQLLQRQKRVQEDIQANEHVRVHGNAIIQAQEYLPQIATVPHPIYLPQGHQSLADNQQNRWTPPSFPQALSQPPSSRTASSETHQSAPSTLPQTFRQPNWSTPSICAPTPDIPQVNVTPSMSQRLQPLDAASSRPMKQPLGSASLPFPGRVANYSDSTDNNINAPRNRYPDAGFAESYRRMPAGALYQPANTMRNPSRSRPPVHTGLSNDARVLENQGISRYRRSFGEGHTGPMNQHALDQQMPQPNPSPRFQHYYPCAPPPFAQQGHGPSNVGLIEFSPRMFLSEVNRAPAVVNQSSLRGNHNGTLRHNHGATNGPQEKGFILPGHHTTIPLRQARDTFRRPPIPSFVAPPDTTPSHDVDRAYDAASVSSPTRHRISNASSKPPRTTPRKENSREQPTTPGTRARSDTKVWIGHLRLDANLGALSRLLQPWSPNKVSGMKVSGAAQEGKSWKKNAGYVFVYFDHPPRATDACQAFAQGDLRFGQEFGYDVCMGPAYIYQAYDETGSSPRMNFFRRSGHQGLIGPDTEQSQPAESHSGPQALVQALPGSNKREQISAELSPSGTNVLHPETESRNPDPCVLETTDSSLVPPSVPTPKHGGAINDRQDVVTQDTAPGVTPPIMAKLDGHVGPSQKTKTPSPKKKKPQNAKIKEGPGSAGQATKRRGMQSNLGNEEIPLDPSPRASTTDNVQHVQSVGEVNPTTHPKNLAPQRKGVEHSNIPVASPKEEAGETTVLMQGGQLTESTLPECNTSAHAESGPTRDQTYSAGEKDSSIASTMQSIPVSTSEPVTTLEHDTQAAALQTPNVGHMHIASEHRVQSGNNGSSPVTTPGKTDVAATKEQLVLDTAVKNKTDNNMSVHEAMLRLSDKPDVVVVAPSESKEVQTSRDAGSDGLRVAIQTGQVTGVFKEGAKQETVPPSKNASSSGHAATAATSQTNSTSPASAQPQKASSPSSKCALPKDPKELIAVPRNLPPVRRQQPQLPKADIKGDKLSKENGEPVGSLKMAENPGTTTPLAPDTIEDLSPSRSTPFSILDEGRSPTVSTVREASEALVDRSQTAERAKDIQCKAEDNTEACELMSASDSVVTAGDDPFDPDTSTPQKFAAAMQKQGTDAPAPQPTEQPAVEQKKGKKKKGKKKSKKSKSSQAEPVDTSNAHEAESTAAHDKEKPAMVPIVERPFVSDEGHDLPPPSFVKRNHSSMRQRIDDGPRNQRLLPSFTVPEDGSFKPAHSLNSTYASASATSTPKPQALIVFSKQSSGQSNIGKRRLDQPSDATLGRAADGRQEPRAASSSERAISDDFDFQATSSNNQIMQITLNGSAPQHRVDEKTGLAKIQEYCQENNKAPSHKIFLMLNTLNPQHTTSNGAAGTAESFDAKSRKRDIAAVLEDSDPVYTVDDAVRQAHCQQIDDWCKKDSEATRSRVTDMLNAIVPELPGEELSDQKLADDDPSVHVMQIHEEIQPNEKVSRSQTHETHNKNILEPSSFERQTHSKQPDEYCVRSGEESRQGISNMLHTIALSDDEDLDEPRIKEISDDEIRPLSPPEAPLKERAQRMLPSRDASPDPSGEDPTEVTAAADEVCEPEPPGTIARLSDRISATRIAASRATASLPSTRRTSHERGRPRSLSPVKGLGLFKVGQPSANVENVSPSRLRPRQSLSYKEVATTAPTNPIQATEFINLIPKDNGQKSRDPWRVPSAEGSWGAANKPRGKSFTEASEAQK